MNIDNAIYNIAGKNAVFTLYTTHTSYATSEHANLTLDGRRYDGLDRWINRPWYEYKYQNARVDAAYRALDDAWDIERRAFMSARGYKRMTARRLEEWTEYRQAPRPADSAVALAAAAYMCAKTEPERYETGRAALQVLEDLESVQFMDAYTIVYTSHASAVLTWHASRMSRGSFDIESEA